MENRKKLTSAAAALATARLTRQPCKRVSEVFGIKTLEEAYAIQDINTRLAISEGRRLIGRKIGLTSLAVQRQLGVDQPDFGMLFADMECQHGDSIDCSSLIQPKVEGEIAFVLGQGLPYEDTTLSEFLKAVDFLLPALEIVDSAIVDWQITLVDTVADNASSGKYVLGQNPIHLNKLDLALEGMALSANDKIVSSGVGADCLGNPLNACLWLARTMAKAGRPLQAGDILLSGALGPMVTVNPGDYLRLQLTRLGEVACQFR